MATKLATILADFQTTLSTEIAIGGTTATLSSATDDDGVALPSGRYFFTLDNSNSTKEHISCDLVGTALTNIKSLSRQGVETTGTVRKHRIGASVTLTDFGHIKFINDLVSGATQLNVSAPLGYDGAPSSLTGNQLATVTYVLGVVNGGAVTFDQQIISNQTSGEALAINDLVYFKESDARWYKVDADLTTTFDGLQTGINKTTAAGASVTIQVAISGPVSGFSGLTAGSKYYASNTAGAITTTAGTYSVFVGWALTTTTLLFNAEGKTLPTQKEKDALVGSQGVPSSTNKYVTQDNQSSAGTDQTQTTQNATVEVGEADATTKKNKLAQSFIPSKTKIRGVSLYKTADTGTFTGTVTVSLQADSSGSPSGTALLTKTFTNTEYLGTAVGEFSCIFSSETSLTTGSLYWIVIETSTSDNSNHPNLGTNSAGGYSSGSVKYKNTTDSWVAIATIDLYFKTLEGIISQEVVTNTSGKIENAFYDITEMPVQAFHQSINADVIAHFANVYNSTSNQDGSVLFVETNVGYLYRFLRNTAGSYFITHKVAVAVSANAGLTILGDYLYRIYDAGATATSYRYLAADLTGETLMSFGTPIDTSAYSGPMTMWADNTYLYTQVTYKGTTVYKLSVSGTVFTQVSTATGATTFGYTGAGSNYAYSSFFDGSNVYLSGGNGISGGNVYTINKLTNSNGSTISTTTRILASPSLTTESSFSINIDSTRMYIGVGNAIFNATTQAGYSIEIYPVTKP